MRAQVAFEYIVIVGIVILFLIPLWSYIAGIESQASGQLALSYAQNAVNKIVSHADLVYSQGSPARIRSQIYIPSRVAEATIINQTVRLRVSFEGTFTDVVAVSIANITGSLPNAEGTYQISVEAFSDHVSLTVL